MKWYKECRWCGSKGSSELWQEDLGWHGLGRNCLCLDEFNLLFDPDPALGEFPLGGWVRAGVSRIWHRFKLTLVESFRWEPCWRCAQAGRWVMARAGGSQRTWGRWGFDQSLRFWPQLPGPGRAVPIPVSARLCPAGTLCSSWDLFGSCLVPWQRLCACSSCEGMEDSWFLLLFQCWFNHQAGLEDPQSSPAPETQSPSLAVPPNFFRKQLYLHVFFKKN